MAILSGPQAVFETPVVNGTGAEVVADEGWRVQTCQGADTMLKAEQHFASAASALVWRVAQQLRWLIETLAWRPAATNGRAGLSAAERLMLPRSKAEASLSKR